MADTGPPWNLRFPGPQDFVRETNFYIEDLAEDTAAALSLAGNAGIGPNVVQTVKTDAFTTTSSSFTPVTGLNATITPTSDSAKVLVLVTLLNGQTGAGSLSRINLVRNSTNLLQSTDGTSNNQTLFSLNSAAIDVETAAFFFVDEPSTTSPTTYSVEVATPAGTMSVNRRADATNEGATSSITLIEVAA